MGAGYHIPARRLTWHNSTLVPGGQFELSDNGMDGFDERFIMRYTIANIIISEQPYADEVAARGAFEKRIEKHYGYTKEEEKTSS